MMDLQYYDERLFRMDDLGSLMELDPMFEQPMRRVMELGLSQEMQSLYCEHQHHAWCHDCVEMAGASVPRRLARRWLMRSLRELQRRHPEFEWEE